jgi:CheY-like chemotaxis protein
VALQAPPITAREQLCYLGKDLSHEQGDGRTPVTEQLRIVVVEDEVFIRLDLVTHLRAAGHAVVGTADSAGEAIRVVERERPDLVVMDVRLVGDRDGIEAAIEIWQRFAIRCLFVSANLDAAARAKARAANPLGFLEKPFTAHSLLTAISPAP